MSSKIIVPRFKAELGYKTTPERSKLMSKIKSTQTKAEILLRKELWKVGVRYRINVKKLPGCPDIVLRKSRLVIFVDGEFWHGYNWETKKGKIKANRDFWIPKIERNIQRDQQNKLALEQLGYTVLRFWEHQIKKDLTGCIEEIKSSL